MESWKVNGLALVRFFIDRGCNPNGKFGDEPTALQLAVNMDIETVKVLLHGGGNINEPASGFSGRTALQQAVSSSQPSLEMVEFLVESGADINAPPTPEFGITALQGAVIKGNMRIALMLLEKGADPNTLGAGEWSRRALEGACGRGRLDIVQLLLNAGAKPAKAARDYAEMLGHVVVADIIRENLSEEMFEEEVHQEDFREGHPSAPSVRRI